MPVDLNNLTDGWLELESDPGLFTLLLENMGVKGVQVEEIYDLQKSFEGKVFGFIFLFKWIEERRSRRKIVEDYNNYVSDENIVNNMFFAQQMVPNSCATHSLVSVLLNCSNLDLGPTLSRLRAHTLGMNPENKGWAIGNTPELANAHNSHAAPQARRRFDKAPGVPTSSRVSGVETFHFVSYVTISGRLYELDGLKPHPIDHGPILDGEDWTEQFRRVITERLGIATGGEPYHDIRFNLMAVVPDKITAYREKLQLLQKNRETILEALHIFIKRKYPEFSNKLNYSEPSETVTADDNTDGSCNLSLLAVAASQKWSSNMAEENFGQDENRDSKDVGYSKPANLEKSGDSQLQKCTTLHDYATPLTIETSLTLPATPSTDTASEAGSAFNSPQICSGSSCQSSPSMASQRLVVVRMAPHHRQYGSWPVHSPDSEPALMNKRNNSIIKTDVTTIATKSNIIQSLENGSFASCDLLQLVKILGTEIDHCQNCLKDELEKRKRYKIDDCRRTHNYDQFLVTLLAMLAEQGKLGDLIQQQLQPTRKKTQPSLKPSSKMNIKKPETKVSPSANVNKKRGRKKKSKGKRKR